MQLLLKPLLQNFFDFHRGLRIHQQKCQCFLGSCRKNQHFVFENKKQSRKDAFDVKFESRVGYEATKQLIKIPDITALIGVNDMLSYGIVNALVDEGYKVPDDYSVCGFDDIFPSAFNQISLTTIDHNLYNKGKDSVDILHKKITIPSYNSNRSIYRIEYKPSLVIRNSTGPAHMT